MVILKSDILIACRNMYECMLKIKLKTDGTVCHLIQLLKSLSAISRTSIGIGCLGLVSVDKHSREMGVCLHLTWDSWTSGQRQSEYDNPAHLIEWRKCKNLHSYNSVHPHNLLQHQGLEALHFSRWGFWPTMWYKRDTSFLFLEWEKIRSIFSMKHGVV